MTNKAIFKTGATYTPIIDTSGNTAARTYVMPDRAGTVALSTGKTATLSSSSGVVTIDCAADADRYTLALTENIMSWSLTNLPAAGTFRAFRIVFTQHNSAAKTVAKTGLTNLKIAGGGWDVTAVLGASEAVDVVVESSGNVTFYPGGVFG